MTQEHSQPAPDENAAQQARLQHVTARVPEVVRRGVFSTGMILITGPTEYVIDFVQNIGQPATVVARVVVPFTPVITDPESLELRWVPVDDVAALPLHPGFAAAWPELRGRLDGDG